MDIVVDKNPDNGTVLEIPKSTSSGIEISVHQPASRPPPPPARPIHRAPPPAVAPRQTASRPFMQTPARGTLFDLANPSKLARPPPENLDDDDPEDDDIDNLSDVPDDMTEEGTLPSNVEYPSDEDEEDKPSPGFKTIDEEKSHIILKMHRLKRTGTQLPRMFGMSSDIREMRSEFARIKAEVDLEASIMWQRSCLTTMVTTIEFLNRRFDPFDLELDGWSGHVRGDIHAYDNVFERLHDKYKNKVQMAPELELLMTVAASALMFHVSNTLFKTALPAALGASGGSGGSGGIDPGMMAGLMASMMKNKSPGGAGPERGDDEPAEERQEDPSRPLAKQRPNMMPPAMDFGSLLSPMAPPPPQMAPPKIAPSERRVTFTPYDPTPPSPLKIPAATPASRKRPPMPEALETDRVSDVPSDMDSIPDDLTSVASGDLVRAVTTGGGRGKKPRVTKNVIKIN